MPYLTDKHCLRCNKTLTIDCLKYEMQLCSECVHRSHHAYERAHGGDFFSSCGRKKISKNLKEYILSRDVNCLSCGSSKNLTIDHITPISKGGDNSHDNLQLLCSSCNSRKSDIECDYREVVEL